jgi:hypothetical protein
MGKAKKEHRAKVVKRNQRIAEEKGKMQRAFNKLLQEQMEKFQENEELNVQVGDQPVQFSVVDPNEVENTIDIETVGEGTLIKETTTFEDEEQ